jgi:putative addiction module antidote
MPALKLTQIGDSVGVILPKKILKRLGVGVGESLLLVETPEGWKITPGDASLNEQIAAGQDLIREYADTFRQLADKEAAKR